MQTQNHKEQYKIKGLLCQISPIYQDKISTIKRIKKSLQRYTSKDNLDIIVFPQLSFTGYNFQNEKSASQLSVQCGKGYDFQFARQISLQTNAYVAFGYIQKTQNGLYNSASVLNRQGQLILNYRKTHLYFNDKLWAQQGEGFKNFQLINLSGKIATCTIGICMDINPKQFTSQQYQLADHMIKTKSSILVFLTNWVDSSLQQIHSNDVSATYTYWIHRLTPVIKTGRNLMLLAADRVGVQYDVFAKKKTRFFGSSCAMTFNPSKIIQTLDIINEGYLVIQSLISIQSKNSQKSL